MHTVSNMMSNLWWFVVTKTFKDIYNLAGPAVPFLVYGLVCVFGFFFILLFLPETRKVGQYTYVASTWRDK